MTAPKYRGLGLSKFLLERIFSDWFNSCDAIYLYANNSVLDFYPKFGFVKAKEYQPVLDVTKKNAQISKLDMTNKSDIEFLYDYYQKSNPFSELPFLDNWGLLMFYCSTFMKYSVYYSSDYKAVVVADKTQNSLVVYDIYCANNCQLADILNAFAPSDHNQLQLGFALKNISESRLSLLQEDTTLFILREKENIFKNHKTMLPLLSHD